MRIVFTSVCSFLILFSFTFKSAFADETNSVTQYGITWTFDKAYESGQFANGDYWVVGPVAITSISPTPSGNRNGTMVNPVPMATQAYDERIGKYDASDLFTSGTVDPGSSVVSTISLEEGGKGREILKTAAVLTVLDSIPADGGATVFRPPYLGTDKPLYSTNDMDATKLQSLPLVSKSKDASILPGRNKRLQLDHLPGISTRGMLPVDNMGTYGGALTRDYGENYLLLSNDYPMEYKIPLLINMVQTGIDYYHAIVLGMSWQTNGGHSSGRKMTVLFAGHILSNSNMLHVMDIRNNEFAEDCQTFYTTENPPTQWGEGIYEAIDPKFGPNYPRYGQRHCTHQNDPNYHGENARGNNSTYSTYWTLNSHSWIGQALAVHLYGLEEAWGESAFLDYVDRFVETEGFTGSWGSSFSDEMWTTYRNNYQLVNPTVAATPKIQPAGGDFVGSALVSISSVTPNAVIYYTEDGSEPTQGSTLYTKPFTITSSKTIMARAYKTDLGESAVDTATFTIETDNTLPYISNVPVTTEANQVVVILSEKITTASAQNTSNYAIDNGIDITSATLSADKKTVTLTVSTLSESVDYTLTVNNIEDINGNPIAPNATASFIYYNMSSDYNLALGKPVSVTSEHLPDNFGVNIVDDDTDDSSRWSADGFPQSATIDLEAICNISGFEVFTYENRVYQYIIKVSDDGTSFTQLVDRSSNTSKEQPIHDFALSSGRYVKITVTGADGYSGTWVSLTELKVFGSIIETTIEPASVSVNPSSLDLTLGDTARLTQTVLPLNTSHPSVTWESDNTAIATVDEDGLVTAISAGNAIITVSTYDGGFAANCNVSVTNQSTFIKSEDTSDALFKVFPNPLTGNKFYIEFSEWASSNNNANEKIQVFIYDITGKQVFYTETSAVNVNGHFKITCRARLRKGVYFVSILSSGTKLTSKLLY